MGIVLDRNELAEMLRPMRHDKTVVFTNGCFDLLHVGHVRYLAQAKALGDILVVGVNSDDSVCGLKGPGRPLVPEAERAEVIAALAAVDFVTIFPEATPKETIEILKPDLHVKGGDYSEEDLVEAETVRSYGGRVVLVDLVDSRSTSALVEAVESAARQRGRS